MGQNGSVLHETNQSPLVLQLILSLRHPNGDKRLKRRTDLSLRLPASKKLAWLYLSSPFSELHLLLRSRNFLQKSQGWVGKAGIFVKVSCKAKIEIVLEKLKNSRGGRGA